MLGLLGWRYLDHIRPSYTTSSFQIARADHSYRPYRIRAAADCSNWIQNGTNSGSAVNIHKPYERSKMDIGGAVVRIQ